MERSKREWKPRIVLDPSIANEPKPRESKPGRKRKKNTSRSKALPKDLEEVRCLRCNTLGDEDIGAASSDEQEEDKAGGARAAQDNTALSGRGFVNDVLFCDNCNSPYCMSCVGLQVIPEDDWFCEVCSAKMARDSARAGMGSPIWASYVNKVRSRVQKIKRAIYVIRTYEADLASRSRASSSSASSSSTKHRLATSSEEPEPLHHARVEMYRAKYEVRNVLKELTELNPGNKRWQSLMDEEKKATDSSSSTDKGGEYDSDESFDEFEAYNKDSDEEVDEKFGKHNVEPQASLDEDDAVDVEDVGCSICLKMECTDDNDVLLCDRAGCFRAYHMNCFSPPITREMLEGPRRKKAKKSSSSRGDTDAFDFEEDDDDEEDEYEEVPHCGGVDDDWFCPQCDCLQSCFDLLNDEFHGSKPRLKSWEQVFPSAIVAPKKMASFGAWSSGLTKFAESGSSGRPLQMNAAQDYDEDEDDEDDEDFDPSAPESLSLEGCGEDEVDSDDDEEDNEKDDEDEEEEDDEEEEEEEEDDDDNDDLGSVHGSELDALSGESDEERDHGDFEGKPCMRLRSKRSAHSSSALEEFSDSVVPIHQVDDGKLDEANIMVGKRRRATVDYVLLNGILFGDGDVDEEELDDYEVWSNPTTASEELPKKGKKERERKEGEKEQKEKKRKRREQKHPCARDMTSTENTADKKLKMASSSPGKDADKAYFPKPRGRNRNGHVWDTTTGAWMRSDTISASAPATATG